MRNDGKRRKKDMLHFVVFLWILIFVCEQGKSENLDGVKVDNYFNDIRSIKIFNLVVIA